MRLTAPAWFFVGQQWDDIPDAELELRDDRAEYAPAPLMRKLRELATAVFVERAENALAIGPL